jgi:tripartite ATP-independent transporter DctM subunit
MLLVMILFLVFMVIGMPIAFAIGISGAVFFLQQSTIPYTVPIQLVVSQTQSFTLLAIPLFIFAGNLLNETGITNRLIKLSSVLAGHMRGGLAQVNVVLSTLMGGVTGSAIGDASMEARILGPAMNERGYNRGFSAGITGYSSLITTMIPPSIGLVLYGSIGEVSIGRLFLGGFVPGLLMALFLMIAVMITARVKGYQPERKRASLKEISTTFAECIWAFLFPILLIVGLRSGLFTPSEAGAFAVVYTLLVGALAYKELKWERFVKALETTVLDIGMIMLLIALSAIFGYGLTWDMIPQQLAQFMIGISTTPWVVLLIMVAFLLIAGMFMDSTVLILLLSSILIPIAKTLGVDTVHFGVIMVLTLTIGLLTPPVGLVLYVMCSIFECSISEFLKQSWLLLAAIVVVILLIIFVPDVVLFLPNLVFGKA